MTISTYFNLQFEQTDDEEILLMKNNFSSIYSYIYSIYGETEENVSLYHLLMALQEYWKN